MDMIRIRPIRVEDTEGVLRILNPLIQSGDHTVLDRVLTVDEERSFISGFPKRGVFHVAERNPGGLIIGFQNVEPLVIYGGAYAHVGVIGTYVDPSGHRQGIGRLLFESTPNGPPARRSEPDWRKEGAYLNRYVTDEQRRRRPIFNATLRAATSSLYA